MVLIQPTNRATAEHYTWSGHCDGWHLLKSDELSVIEEQMPPGTSEVRHYHRRAQQFFFILAGECVMEVGGTDIPLGSGAGLHIPSGVPHQIRNESERPVQFLVISQPRSHGDRIVCPR
jgi:mannose-6-phosphate isomerase-like protein (cupin superfamily)